MSHIRRQGKGTWSLAYHPSHPRLSFISLSHVCRLITIVFLLLIVCLGDLHNTMSLALYQPSTSSSGVGSNNGLKYYYHQHRRFQQGSHHLGGAGIPTLSDEGSLQTYPIVGPTEDPRRKKDCGEPSIATKGLVGPTLKSSCFATTPDDKEEKTEHDEFRKKREISESVGSTDPQDSPLPWACETKYEWRDMGPNIYPRFVRTAECKSATCFNELYTCVPRRYHTKLLKRLNPTDSTSHDEEVDVSLPESLRTHWKFITVTINVCCECGRLPAIAPGNAEV